MSEPHIDAPRAEAASAAHSHVRGLRVMAVARWALLVFVAAIAVGTWWRFVVDAEPSADGRPARFYCPMHPQIRAPDPGTCPICFMSLEPIPDHGSQHVHGDAAEPAAGDPGAPEDPSALVPVMLTTERQQRAGIAVAAARAISIGGSERWPASIESQEGARAEVRVRAPAFVERVAITRSNERVRAGQTLAWVYSPEIVRAQEELLVAQRWGHGEESLSVAATARERLVLLGMSARDIDAMLASGRAQRTVAVRAPMSGHVTAFEAVVGSYVTPDTRLYEITDFSRVRVVATPFTDDVSWLAPGVTARFVPRGGGAPVIVAFDLVEPGVTESTRTLRARFDPPRDASLRPGDIGELIVERPPRDAIVVPRDAVIDTGRARYVFVERRAGTFEPRRVELGALHGEERIITAGLEAGERVVARGAFVLDSESRLQAALAPSEGDAAKPAPHAHAHEASP